MTALLFFPPQKRKIQEVLNVNCGYHYQQRLHVVIFSFALRIAGREIMLSQQDIQAELAQAEEELKRCQQKIAQLRKHRTQNLEQDYAFSGPNNSQDRLSELFGKHEDLILIHNMGAGCMYCTMWADGLNGLFP